MIIRRKTIKKVSYNGYSITIFARYIVGTHGTTRFGYKLEKEWDWIPGFEYEGGRYNSPFSAISNAALHVDRQYLKREEIELIERDSYHEKK